MITVNNASDLLVKASYRETSVDHSNKEELFVHNYCYICKKKYIRVHFFYDQLCEWCGSLNHRKRSQFAELSGRVALITGGRIKIGYQCALQLLRCGAMVIITTRFPVDAALRYVKEADFEMWKDRLHIYGLDFRDVIALEQFALFIDQYYKALNIIINNAAQTVRKPPSFYLHLLSAESKRIRDFPERIQDSLQLILRCHNERWVPRLQGTDISKIGSLSSPHNEERNYHSYLSNKFPVAPSAVLPMIPFTLEDSKHDETLFPLNKLDEDGQQVDNRQNNTWNSTIEHVSIVELMETHTINSIAPFVLISRLKSVLERSSFKDKYIINVSSMEGKFYQPFKSERHPHNNMAKAGLNMLTHTIASSFAKEGIYVNSVDTGWITDETPRQRMRKEQSFEPPLDEIDGMARVLDPIFKGINHKNWEFGMFYKDYQSTPW